MRHPRGRGSAGEPELGTGLRAVLWLAAFAAGFAVTGLEVALGRLLAPHFGASLTVWASVIAAVVAALALGYPLGGILADRHPGPGLPLGALLLGGLLGALLGVAAPPWLRASMQGIALSGPAYSLRLAGALALFGLPCLLLASVAPAVLRVTLRERATAGRDAGVLFALGSLGSVLGVLLSALWWIPMLGLRATFLLLAAVAMAPPLFAMLSGLARVGAVTRAAALILLAAFPLLPEAVVSDDSGRLLHDADSGLQHIRVLARDTPEHRRRWLMLDEGWTAHSALLEPSLATGDVWD